MAGLDAQTSLVVSTLVMLANGALLGLVHRDLPSSMRPAAISWLVGTLLMAAGAVTFAVQLHWPSALVVTAANGLVLFGFSAYWRSLRQFYGYPAKTWRAVPAVVATLGIYVFAAFQPNVLARILIASIGWLVIMGGCLRILQAGARVDAARSRRGLAMLFVGVMAFITARALYCVAADLDPSFVVVDSSNWMNVATAIMSIAVPIVGSTAFVLMCSERVGRQWAQAAATDYLTGLANRRTVTEAGKRRFVLGEGRLPGGALVMLDIDHFKTINDEHGHELGDGVLKHVADRLAAVTRDGELLGRLGGEEFVVLLANVGHEHQAAASAERMWRMVREHPFVNGTGEVKVTVSVGVAVARSCDEDFDSLLRRADRALYEAKAAGRDRIAVDVVPAATQGSVLSRSGF